MTTLDINTAPGDIGADALGVIRHEHYDEGQCRRTLPPAGYQLTRQDVIYLAVSAAGENVREPGRTIWCMLQRFVGAYTNRGTLRASSLKRLVETFSQPVNPAWAFIDDWVANRPMSMSSVGPSGADTGIPWTPTQGAKQKAIDAYLISRGQPFRYSDRQFVRANPDRWRSLTSTEVQRRRQNNIRRAQVLFEGGSDARTQWGNLASNVRRAIYTILQGGSPIPREMVGFDDFASTTQSNIVDLWRLSSDRRDELLRNTGYWQNRQHVARFIEGGEWYVYHSLPHNYGDIYIVGPEGNTRGATGGSASVFAPGANDTSSRRTSVPGAVAGGGSDVRVSQTSVNDETFDVWDILPPDQIRGNMRRWADETVVALTEAGLVRRERF